MTKILAALFILIGPVARAADTFTTRLTLNKPATSSTNWAPKINGDLDIIDGAFLIRSSDTMTGPLTMSNSSITLTGSGGFVKSSSSITASAFFGNGAGLTGVAAGVAGANTQIQYNNGGVAGASADLTWDNSAKLFTSSSVYVLSQGPNGVKVGGSTGWLIIQTAASPSASNDVGVALVPKGGGQSYVGIANVVPLTNIDQPLTVNGNANVRTGKYLIDGAELTKSSCTIIANVALFTNTAYGVAFATVTLTARGTADGVGVSLNAIGSNTGNARITRCAILVDGGFALGPGAKDLIVNTTPSAGGDMSLSFPPVMVTGLTAASHTFALTCYVSAGAGSILNDATHYTQFCAKERP